MWKFFFAVTVDSSTGFYVQAIFYVIDDQFFFTTKKGFLVLVHVTVPHYDSCKGSGKMIRCKGEKHMPLMQNLFFWSLNWHFSWLSKDYEQEIQSSMKTTWLKLVHAVLHHLPFISPIFSLRFWPLSGLFFSSYFFSSSSSFFKPWHLINEAIRPSPSPPSHFSWQPPLSEKLKWYHLKSIDSFHVFRLIGYAMGQLDYSLMLESPWFITWSKCYLKENAIEMHRLH